jgi:hypothetical protein
MGGDRGLRHGSEHDGLRDLRAGRDDHAVTKNQEPARPPRRAGST